MRSKLLRGDGGKKARSPGRARRKPLKPLRAGTPGDSGVLVYSCAFFQCKAHARLRVQRASGVPHALYWARDKCKPRAHRVARIKSYAELYQRHCERSEAIHSFFARQDGLLRFARNDGGDTPHSRPSSPAKAGDPVFRGVSDGIERPRRTGYPACAGYDGR